MPRALHQLVAGFSNGDAISNEARVLRGIFRTWGFVSEIYCERARVLPELRPGIRDLSSLGAEVGPEDIVLLHLSIGSPANLLFRELAARKAVLYHNITPPEHFRAVNEHTAAQLARGREQARGLAGVAQVNLADSAFNARELAEWGYANPRVLPLVLDLEGLRGPPDRAWRERYADGRTNVLFVGRGVPNKRLEDVISTFGHFQRAVRADSRLIHVGSFGGAEVYRAVLTTRVKELGLRDVDFHGSLPDAQLRACYASAHAFLCLSEHEGFCIPVLEAMAWDVPVLAYAACAVPETMDGAGVLAHHKDFPALAEMLGRLATPGPLREAVLAGQRARIARYRARDLGAELRGHLAPLLA
jgi:glycosyltransferase involved in cell wall biosynthesis